MKPPICRICNRALVGQDDGGLIYFKKRPSDIQWEKKMEEIQGVGHPPNAEWFCEEHYGKAKKLRKLTIDKAIKKLTR